MGDKVPDYINVPTQITKPYPECRIITVQRPLHAIVHSVLDFNRLHLHLFASSRAFSTAVAIMIKQKGMDRFLDNFPNKQTLAIGQAELLDSPVAIAEKASKFLGVIPDDALCIYARNMHKNVAVKNWRKEMTRDDKDAIKAVWDIFNNGAETVNGEKTSKTKWHDKACAFKQILSLPNNDIGDFTTTLRKSFSTPTDLEDIGFALMHSADYDHTRSNHQRAYTLFSAALQCIPDNPVFYYKLGLLCFDMKLTQQALHSFKKAATICPNTQYHAFLKAKIFYMLGRLHHLNGSYSDGADFYRTAIAIKPNFQLPNAMLQLLMSKE